MAEYSILITDDRNSILIDTAQNALVSADDSNDVQITNDQNSALLDSE